MFAQSVSSRSFRRIMASALAVAAVAACGESRAPLAPELEASFAKGAPSADIPVVTTVGAGTLGSDGLGSYVNGMNGVSSRIFANGNYELSTQDRSTRRLVITFDSVTSGTAPFASAAVQGRFVANIELSPDGAIDFQTMTAGQAHRTPLAVPFSYGGKDYRLAMNSVNQPSSNWALATCESTTSPCTQWRITPTGENGRNTAVLIEIGKNNVETVRGTVRVSFDIGFTR